MYRVTSEYYHMFVSVVLNSNIVVSLALDDRVPNENMNSFVSFLISHRFFNSDTLADVAPKMIDAAVKREVLHPVVTKLYTVVAARKVIEENFGRLVAAHGKKYIELAATIGVRNPKSNIPVDYLPQFIDGIFDQKTNHETMTYLNHIATSRPQAICTEPYVSQICKYSTRLDTHSVYTTINLMSTMARVCESDELTQRLIDAMMQYVH